MKKLIILFFAVQYVFSANAQWVEKVIRNPFDEEKDRVFCHTKIYTNTHLRLEKNKEKKVMWYMIGKTFCEDTLNVDFAFLIGDEYSKISKTCYVDSSGLILDSDLILSNIKEDFLDCTEVSIRVNQKDCITKIYTFDIRNSERALRFICKN